MKIIRLILTAYVSLASYSLALASELKSDPPYDYVKVPDGGHFQNQRLCPGITLSIKSGNDQISLGANGKWITINKDDPIESSEFIIGDLWNNRHCYVATKVAESDVNESYELYEINPSSAPTKSKSPNLINPEFKGGTVISSYRDAARWHKEFLCYSVQTGSPYLCEKRTSLNDSIEKKETCDQRSHCSSPILVSSNTDKQIMAVISTEKAFTFSQKGDKFSQNHSYLIKGDTIILVDFEDLGSNLYYRFKYEGKSKETDAWINSTEVKLL
ncbi:hypothetical protein [Xanthomonas oryzae]|uniref:hypothetical protein n=1 Tax=Xanthomonas oryzae TaxID=347 RepID=UPI001033E503|nr:hypothetical protein [Xanthomonas oryzae]QBG99193.1 hypothetical protein EYC56_07190 [Xanthomonas oryzae]